MGRSHKFYLSLGSNVEPDKNLAAAMARLRERGIIRETSSVWESPAVGAPGPNFLNLCVSYEAQVGENELKTRIIRPIESALGRIRSHDKNSPRTIDIDIVMVDGRPLSLDRWEHAFVALPMSELRPQLSHPLTHHGPAHMAPEHANAAWIVRRQESIVENSQPM